MQQNIHILDTLTARKIAAGEVIERPSCIVRELIDNCIDAKASQIEITIANGGLDMILISDDGVGMTKEDLQMCYKTHATSKIQKIEDLSHILSMGFRGEALSSISAISCINITSFDNTKKQAYSIQVEGTQVSLVQDAVRNKGTAIKVEKIFNNIAVRKKFLANASTEKNRIKNVILQKAIAFPEIAFTLKEGNTSILQFPKEAALKRAVRICSQKNTNNYIWQDAHTWNNDNNSYTISGAFGLPEIALKTRKHIHIYVNKRPIRSFELLQALEYAYKDTLHLGLSPQAVLFLELPAPEIDVNIHPTKQEIRIKNISTVRSFIIQTIKNLLVPHTQNSAFFNPPPSNNNNNSKLFEKEQDKTKNKAYTIPVQHNLLRNTYRATENKDFNPSTANKTITAPRSYEQTHPQSQLSPKEFYSYVQENKNHTQNTSVPNTQKTQYIGCVFSTYVILEQNDELLLLDFHATHERKIFDELKQNPKPHTLLLPIPLIIDAQESDIVSLIKNYKILGIEIEQNKEIYQLVAVPQILFNDAEKIAKYIQENTNTDVSDVKLFASKACRQAIKAGDHIDENTAYKLLNYAQSLHPPRCPHGRPLWICITKNKLDSLIQRI